MFHLMMAIKNVEILFAWTIANSQNIFLLDEFTYNAIIHKFVRMCFHDYFEYT